MTLSYNVMMFTIFSFFFFFNDTATTEIYTLSLHDALPISDFMFDQYPTFAIGVADRYGIADERSEEHTSELQSQSNLVCRLLLEKKKNKKSTTLVNVSTSPHDTDHLLVQIDHVSFYTTRGR